MRLFNLPAVGPPPQANVAQAPQVPVRPQGVGCDSDARHEICGRLRLPEALAETEEAA